MMKLIKIFLIVLSIIYLSGCASFRTAEGLSGGEVNISYMPPFGGAFRVGLSNNIETRVTMIHESFRADIFLHTKKDSGKINFGIVLGTSLFIEENKSYYAGLTVGIRSGNFYPYLSVNHFSNLNGKKFSEVSLGSEIKIYEFGDFSNKIIFTPEISIPIPPFRNGLFNPPLYGSVGIGYTFNFMKMFK